MIPIRDNIPSKTVPIVNYGIIGTNVLVFAVQAGSGLTSTIEKHAFYPNQLKLAMAGESLNIAPLQGAVTSMFLHAGVFHLLGNMLYLYIFGDNVEDRFGRLRYFLLYLFFGITAALVHFATGPDSAIPVVGASGAVAGVMGAYFVFYPSARVLTLIPLFFFIQFAEIPALFFLAFWFFLQFLYGTLSSGSDSGQGVAWWAHAGGFAAGMATAVLVSLIDRITGNRLKL